MSKNVEGNIVLGTIIEKDYIVIGAGLSGICAAIAAAREGLKVSLVHDRPVPGGNSSSEIRVGALVATGECTNRYAAETGITGEIIMENLYKNPDGNPYIWDAILIDFIKRECNIDLFLNTPVTKVELDNGLLRNVSGI